MRVYLYTVPGQVHYNATRKLVLAGSDGVVFVADSQRARSEANAESLEDLHENLFEQGIDPTTLPMVLQFNKRDIADVMTVGEMNGQLNADGRLPHYETTAIQGKGVVDALRAITRRTLQRLQKSGVFTTQSRADLSPPASLFGEPPSEGMGEQIARYAAQITTGGEEEPQPPARPAIAVAPAPAPAPSLAAAPAPLAPPVRLVGRDEPLGLSFAALWPDAPARAAAREAERLLAHGDLRGAVAAAAELLRVTLDGPGLPAVLDGAGELARVQLLGLDGRDWLRFHALAARAAARTAEAPTAADALFALHFAIGARLRVAKL